jgi:hypothetical protein
LFGLHLAGNQPNPFVDPAKRWIAYGVVLDTNGDGRADVRFGMDKTDAVYRAWRTDLATGQTASRVGPPFGSTPKVDGAGRILDWYFPGDDFFGPTMAAFYYFAEPGEPMPRWYGWASMIEGGRIVSTDFAPDVGWLVEPPSPT